MSVCRHELWGSILPSPDNSHLYRGLPLPKKTSEKNLSGFLVVSLFLLRYRNARIRSNVGLLYSLI